MHNDRKQNKNLKKTEIKAEQGIKIEKNRKILMLADRQNKK